jgi:hypothetical protein
MATAQKTAWLATPIGVAAESQSTAQQGWLPLTKANKRPDKSTVVTSKAYDVRGKIIVIELDYVSWGGNGGQGLVVYLFDASAPAAGSGGIGGIGLGYVRMIGAYIGIGLDESGSFSSIDAKSMSETTKDSGAGNFVTVRGSQERNFARDGMFALSPQMPLFYEAARYASRQKLLDSGGIRHVVAKLTPKKYLPGYTVDLMINGEFIVQEFDYPYAVPASVKAGIAATNGDRTSNHEIKNFDFNLLDPVGIECPENGNVLRNIPAYITHSNKAFAYPQLNDGDHVHRGWDGKGKWGDIPKGNVLYGVDISGAACRDSDGFCAAPAGKGAVEINTVAFYCRQDDGTQQEPSDATTFSQHGAIDFTVLVRSENTSAWTKVASDSGSNLVKRVFTFPPRRCWGVEVSVSKAEGTGPALVGLEAYNR